MVFEKTDILLPKVKDHRKWAVVACDQFTSQPEYWENVQKYVGDEVSTYNLILPEAQLLENNDDRIANINETMNSYLKKNIFEEYNNSYVYVERKLKNGEIRKGIVGAIDLEDYDYRPNAKSKIRATEKTVIERIPPRVKIRENADIELPHILLLCDDQEHQLLESVEMIKEKLEILYDFDLMQDGGHITGWLVSEDKAEVFDVALEKYFQDIREKYHGLDENLMFFAVGDGNHSLATAKECYERQKKAFGTSIKARYALVELENLQDESQQFEPIHRLLMNVDISDFLTKIKTICVSYSKHKVVYYTKEKQGILYLDESLGELTVGILQRFLDDYVKTNNCDIDYIHDDDVLKKLSCKSDCIGLLLSAIDKENLFSEIIKNGSLPRKTFSMGHAQEKRYYIEARRIK